MFVPIPKATPFGAAKWYQIQAIMKTHGMNLGCDSYAREYNKSEESLT